MRDKMNKDEIKHQRTEKLEYELPALIHNKISDIEEAFEMAKTLYKRTNNHRAENAKHHLALALGELRTAHEWAEEKKVYV